MLYWLCGLIGPVFIKSVFLRQGATFVDGRNRFTAGFDTPCQCQGLILGNEGEGVPCSGLWIA
jgi:hypothetical protein